MQVRRDGRVEPALAESWSTSSDGLTWRFVLRPDLVFHNGAPIDATTVAAWLRTCGGGGRGAPGCRDIQAVEVDGPRTVVVRLAQPSGLLLDSLSLLALYNDQKRSFSAGPFRDVSSGKYTAFESFSHYYRGQPSVMRIDLKLFPDQRNAWTAMMRGEIDMLYEVAPDSLDFIEQSSNTQVRSILRPYVMTMGLNVRHPVLADRDVRRALNLAVNRTEIIKRVFRGHGYPATDHVWPRHWAYHHELPRLRYDPATATRLLEGRGLRLPIETRATTPSRFQFTCLIPDKDLRFERMGLLIQRQLLEVGIDMQLEPVSVETFLKRLPLGQFDAYMVDLISSAGLDRVYEIWHSPEEPPLFDSGYRAADAALDLLRTAQSDQDTQAAVAAVQRVMREDPPAVFLLWSETARAVSARFRVPHIPDRDVLATLPQWQLLTPPASSP